MDVYLGLICPIFEALLEYEAVLIKNSEHSKRQKNAENGGFILSNIMSPEQGVIICNHINSSTRKYSNQKLEYFSSYNFV